MVALSVGAAFGTAALYTPGYTITQDAVASASMSGIGIATGMAAGFGYLIAMFAGPLVGALTPALGPHWAMNLTVILGEVMVAVLAFWFLRPDAPRARRCLSTAMSVAPPQHKCHPTI